MEALQRALPPQLVSFLQAVPNFGPALPFVPKSIKFVLLALIVYNWKSFPLLWHFRVLGPAYLIAFKERLRPGSQNLQVGIDPFKTVISQKFHAGPDDCDWNGHLSNSCYAKNSDVPRMAFWTRLFGNLFREERSWQALGGATYYYYKEIKAGTNYEIRVSVGGWEQDKWIYYVTKFVSKKPKGKGGKTDKPSVAAVSAALDAAHTEGVTAGGPAASTAPSGTSTPIPSFALKDIADDEILHCVSITMYCSKIGRITVPPSVVFAATAVGPQNGCHNWAVTQALRKERAMRDYLKGGWREKSLAVVGYKWGEFDAINERNMKVLSKVGQSMREALTL